MRYFLIVSLWLVACVSGQTCTTECGAVCTDVCPNNCNSPLEQGTCDMEQGKCVCNPSSEIKWGGDDCGTEDGPAPKASSGNTVNLAELETTLATLSDFTKNIRDKAEDLYVNPNAEGSTSPVNMCDERGDDGMGTVECNSDFGLSDACQCNGRKVGMNVGYQTTCKTETAAMNDLSRNFGILEDTYKSNLEAGDKKVGWQYYGTEKKVFQKYPAASRWRTNEDGESGCLDYDPTIRPWYVTAASGPKRVVIILDGSGSMGSENRWESATAAAKEVIGGLSFNDYLGLVVFSEYGDTWEQGMVKMNPEGKDQAKAWIDTKGPTSTTGCKAGMQAAVSLLKDKCVAGSDCRENTCRSSILFLADGECTTQPFDGFTMSPEEQAESDFFFYAFGAGMTQGMDDYAATVDGLSFKVQDGGALDKCMSGYYRYYAEGMSNQTNDESFVRWSEPYMDASGLGPTITAAAPVYDRSGPSAVFKGVVGVDFPACDLFETASASDILTALSDASKRCPRQWDTPNKAAIQSQVQAICDEVPATDCTAAPSDFCGAASLSGIIAAFTTALLLFCLLN